MRGLREILGFAAPKAVATLTASAFTNWLDLIGYLDLRAIDPATTFINDAISIIAGLLAILRLIEFLVRWSLQTVRGQRCIRHVRRILADLRADEEKFLRAMLISNQRSVITLDPVVQRLVKKGLLEPIAPSWHFMASRVVWNEMHSRWL